MTNLRWRIRGRSVFGGGARPLRRSNTTGLGRRGVSARGARLLGATGGLDRRFRRTGRLRPS